MHHDTKLQMRRRRRDCRDRARRWALEQQKKRKPNPAAKVASQLFLLFSALVFSMPMPTPVLSPGPRPEPRPRRKPDRKQVSAVPAQPVYSRYDAAGWPSRYRGRVPSYRTLLAHVQGGSKVRREDALHVLRRRVDADLRPWLDDIIGRSAWGDLAATIRPDASENETVISMLEAALAWVRSERERETVVLPFVPDDDEKGPK